MYREILYFRKYNQDKIIFVGEWKQNIKHCFKGNLLEQESNKQIFRKIESRFGTILYYYCIYDSDGKLIIRSEDYFDCEKCLIAAELCNSQPPPGMIYNYSINKWLQPVTYPVQYEC